VNFRWVESIFYIFRDEIRKNDALTSIFQNLDTKFAKSINAVSIRGNVGGENRENDAGSIDFGIKPETNQ